jgi:hypothetical protein
MNSHLIEAAVGLQSDRDRLHSIMWSSEGAGRCQLTCLAQQVAVNA